MFVLSRPPGNLSCLSVVFLICFFLLVSSLVHFIIYFFHLNEYRGCFYFLAFSWYLMGYFSVFYLILFNFILCMIFCTTVCSL